MQTYLLRRLLLIVPTLVLVSLIVFFSIRLIPGDVIDAMAGEVGGGSGMGAGDMTSEDLKRVLGLDVPVHIQYFRWIGQVFQGDLGLSLWTQRPISEDIAKRLPVSLELGILAINTGLLIALPVGVYSAIRQDTGLDYVGRTIAILFISVPSFWIGTMVMVYPSIWWGWTPPMEFNYLGENPGKNLAQLIIPALIMGMAMSGGTMRMTRTMMLEVLRQDYIRTAWSKGLNERTVILRHALKNALIPVITIIGLQTPVLIGGAVIIETIFNLPGVGRYMLEAVTRRDYPIISGLNLVIAAFILFINLVVDLTYAYLDPRVHYN
ncbi:MAG: ABC transporter permease [Chloroflexi bacterium]|nr:ABC transporter permease [Chloroflexota bacterium]